MFDHKIEKFTKTVGGLPDQPNIEPQALKNWFDAAPEELRQSLNGVCEDGAALESRVNGIIDTTFPDAIREDMLESNLRKNIVMQSDIVVGEYIGDGVYPRKVALGFRPKAVYAQYHDATRSSLGYVGHALFIDSGKEETFYTILDDGFLLKQDASVRNGLNVLNYRFIYIALRG